MAETFIVKCPACDQPHRVGDQHRGKRIKCRECEKVIAIPAADAGSTVQKKAAVPPVQKARQPEKEKNPYAAFEDDGFGGADGEVADDVIDELRKTRPWVRLVGFLGVIGVIFSAVLIAISIMSAMTAIGGVRSAGIITILIQIVGLAIYFCAAKFLIGYSRSIGRLDESGDIEDLISALKEQRRFWVLQGILIVVALGIGLIVALFAIFIQVT